MKKFFILAIGSMMMAACSNESIDSQLESPATDHDGVSFGITLPNPTRVSNTYSGQTAAEKLNGNFVVYGFKYYTAEEPTSVADVADLEKQQTVFDLYNVNYEYGTDSTTQSNTKGWEYVGFQSAKTPAETQTIRYWDYAATGYVFSAVSGTDITVKKVETGATVYDKGWKITVPKGGSFRDLYVSARQPMLKPTPQGTKYEGTVDLTFYSVLSKVRFAMYETVPGYNIHIDRFYYDNGASSSTTNFAVDGNFRIVNPNVDTELTVTYYDNSTSVENRPKVSYDQSSVISSQHCLFGANIQAQDLIGTTSNEATYDKADGDYTLILPCQLPNNRLSLRVDYTLKALSGNETIKVTGATASVPAGYLQWKENFAYTYIFKISDNTNGSTTPGGPEGLYPITFDGFVVADEEGVQETVSTVSEPTFTTYQKGVVVTENNEYVAGDIYYTMMKQGVLQTLDGSEVFEVNNLAKGEVTEALVMNHNTNAVVLTPVEAEVATLVPLTDGTSLTFDQGQCYKFTAAEGKTYAIMKNDSCKLVKVEGTPEAPEYKLACPAGSKITIQTGMFDVTLTNTKAASQASKGVLGAKSLLSVWQNGQSMTGKFAIEEKGAGVYTLSLTPEAIGEGVDGEFTLKFNNSVQADNTFNVELGYTLDPSSALTVIAGKTATFELKAGGEQVLNAEIVNTHKGIQIENMDPSGLYLVSVAANVPTDNYNITVAGLAYQIKVKHYDFAKSAVTLTWSEGAQAPSEKLQLIPEDGDADIESSNASVMAGGKTDSDGKFLMKAKAGGKTTLSFETAKCDITVNQYLLESDVQTINKGNGVSVLTFKCNGELQSSWKNYVKVSYSTSAGGTYSPVTDIFSLAVDRKTVKFGNVTKSGYYKLECVIKVSGVDTVVGTELIEVVAP